MIAIRRLRIDDVADYRTIRLAALKASPEAFGSTYDGEAAKPMAAHAERLATSDVYGAYADDRIIGLAGFKQESGPKNAHKGFVWGVFVAPDRCGEGIGTALMQRLILEARTRVEQLTLNVVADNKTAIALYRRLGFESYGTEQRSLKDASGYVDELLMVLILERSPIP